LTIFAKDRNNILIYVGRALEKFKLFWFLALDLCGWKNQMCLNVRWRSGVAYNVSGLGVRAGFSAENSKRATKFKYTKNCQTETLAPPDAKPLL